ncbi:MAG: prepilin peptidase [Thermacetogeniaceae bacterium]
MRGCGLWSFSVLYAPIALALLGAGFSVYTDIKWGKIKNFVTFPLILIGWAVGFLGGWKAGVTNIIASCAVGAMSTLIGRIGDGDIKLIAGISACLRPGLTVLFGSFFFMVTAAAAFFVRFRAYGFKLKPALQAMKAEAIMELGGDKDAGTAVHGAGVRHVGAPQIFIALLLSLIWAKVVGMI